MATANPLPENETVRWLRTLGIDPARVPHAGAATLEGLRAEVRELADLGLDVATVHAALGGGPSDAGGVVLRTPEELEVWLESNGCGPST